MVMTILGSYRPTLAYSSSMEEPGSAGIESLRSVKSSLLEAGSSLGLTVLSLVQYQIFSPQSPRLVTELGR